MAKKRAPKAKDDITSIGDDQGNLILIHNNGKRLILTLKLNSESKGRRLGVVNLGTKIMEIKRDREKHLHILSNSYGFNYNLLDRAKKFHTIRLIDQVDEWKIPIKYILDNGKILYFKQQGFELQTFLSLSDMEQFKRPAKL